MLQGWTSKLMKNKLTLMVAPAAADIACCTPNLDKDEKHQRDVISHYCFIVYFQRTANDAENIKSSCSPLHGERQIFSFCWVTSNPNSGTPEPKFILGHLDIGTTLPAGSDSTTSICCAHCPFSQLPFTRPGCNLLCLQSFLQATEVLYSFVSQGVVQEV